MAGSSTSWVVQIDQLGSETAGAGSSWSIQIDQLGSETAGTSSSWVILLPALSPQIAEIRTRQVRGLVGCGDWTQRIASSGQGLVLNSVAGTLLFTVPSDPSIYGYYITDVIIRADEVSAVTTPPTFALGTTNAGIDIIPATVMTGFTAVDTYWIMRIRGIFPFLEAGKTVYFNITSAGSATQLIGQVELMGFPVVT